MEDSPYQSIEEEEVINLSKWMAKFQHKRLWDLTLPGSHDSTAYTSKNFLWIMKKYMTCQDMTIY